MTSQWSILTQETQEPGIGCKQQPAPPTTAHLRAFIRFTNSVSKNPLSVAGIYPSAVMQSKVWRRNHFSEKEKWIKEKFCTCMVKTIWWGADEWIFTISILVRDTKCRSFECIDSRDSAIIQNGRAKYSLLESISGWGTISRNRTYSNRQCPLCSG